MQSRWDDDDAAATVARLAGAANADMALRVYTSRLIGADSQLVLHGGGNTSVKTHIVDVLGERREALCVKGSGWDLASIEPAGLPALDLPALRRLRELSALSDSEMVNQLRIHLFEAASPMPSVETLLHAFLDDRFVDHTHADAALIFGNRPEGASEIAAVVGNRVGVLPWIMPGFPLAIAVAKFRDEHPDAIGLVLHEHGVFSWGEDARTSYERHIDIVDRVERAIADRLLDVRTVFDIHSGLNAVTPAVARAAADVAPVLRGLLAEPVEGFGWPKSFVVEWRGTRETLAAAASPTSVQLFSSAPLTPDHVIRTKAAYLVSAGDRESLVAAVHDYVRRYLDYVSVCSAGRTPLPTMLDPFPRVALIDGVGVLAWGTSKKAARIAADIAEHTVVGKVQAEALSSYAALSDCELFEMEYWSLEQAKLGRASEAPLARRVALVTGAAGAIGVAVARRLLRLGAHVALSDIDSERLERARAIAVAEDGIDDSRVHTVVMDVTSEVSVQMGFSACARHFGGVDILVANAGVAHVASLEALTLEDWDRLVRVNETGTFLCFREAARLMRRQGLGGRIILNASKNVPAPGADFAAYSASKAAAVQLARVAALELAGDQILVNVVHPDAVFADDTSGTSSGLWDAVGAERMRSRGMSGDELREHYRKRNLLGVPITADHVADAVAFFAEGRTPTTGAALTVDGGLKETFYR